MYKLMVIEALCFAALANLGHKVRDTGSSHMLFNPLTAVVAELERFPTLGREDWRNAFRLTGNNAELRQEVIYLHLVTGLAITTCYKKITQKHRHQAQQPRRI